MLTHLLGSTFKLDLDLSGQGLICVFLKRKRQKNMPVSNRALGMFLEAVQCSISCYLILMLQKDNQGVSLYFIRHLVTRVLTLALP